VGLYNHDLSAVLGRTPATLRLARDAQGIAFELDAADTQIGRDTAELVRRGDIKGASFGFRTLKDAWHVEDGTMVRELLDLDLAEISLTAFPVYPETDVTLAQRSVQAWQKNCPPRRGLLMPSPHCSGSYGSTDDARPDGRSGLCRVVEAGT
jgi:HK97 family phage prohead protease